MSLDSVHDMHPRPSNRVKTRRNSTVLRSGDMAIAGSLLTWPLISTVALVAFRVLDLESINRPISQAVIGAPTAIALLFAVWTIFRTGSNTSCRWKAGVAAIISLWFLVLLLLGRFMMHGL